MIGYPDGVAWIGRSVLILAGVLAVTPVAMAEDPPAPPEPPETSSPASGIAQYTEVVPSSTGSKILTTRRGPTVTSRLPATVSNEIQRAGTKANQLREIATSSRFGAPRHIAAPAPPWSHGSKVAAAAAQGSELDAFGNAMGRGAIPYLVVSIALISAAAVASAAVRRRSHS